jgi:5'-nucleotidase / UDP-sugar diphosphatase
MLKRFLLLALLAIPAVAKDPVTITLLHFSDYHSHAVPFWNDHQPGQGGLARAIHYLETEKKRGALVLSGGDMMNHGSPAWSDKYECTEWAWMNGIVDAMAFGNHDADYGTAKFQRCRDLVRFPILSANTTDANVRPLLPPYVVLKAKGLRIGVFALAGSDFTTLVKPENRPAAGAVFGDPVAAARETVKALRDREHVDAVVMIGHEQLDDDLALAKSVPGIDVIFGTHSHLRRDFMKIPGTQTYFLSPFQYLTLVSRVELTFHDHTLASVQGELVHIAPPKGAQDKSACATCARVDEGIAGKVVEMQTALQRDPEFAPLFRPLGRGAEEIGNDGQLEHDAPLGNLVTDVMRSVAQADVALVTSSSFRQSLPPGELLVESLHAAMPYENDILVYPMTGEQLAKLIGYSVAHHGTDAFAQLSGARVRGSFAAPAIDIGGAPLDPARTYRVAVTNFQALVAPGYREVFAPLTKETTGLKLRESFQAWIAKEGTIHPLDDHRIDLGGAR